MNTMLSTCGCSIAHAKFPHKKQVATHRPLQHKREAKVIHMARVVSSPMYPTTLISRNKLLENRLGSQFLSSSNYPSSCFQLRSYSSKSESSNNLSISLDPPESDIKGSYWPSPDVGLMAVGVVIIGGLALASLFQRRPVYLLGVGALILPFARPPVKEGTIKVGTIDGQVKKMLCTLTSLINSEELSGIVPITLFLSQVIVNIHGVKWCANLNKIPIQINDKDKFQFLAREIKAMLQTHPKVFLGKDAPFCYLSRYDKKRAELVFGFNLESMKKDELFACERDILFRALRIIRQHGAEPNINPIRLKWW